MSTALASSALNIRHKIKYMIHIAYTLWNWNNICCVNFELVMSNTCFMSFHRESKKEKKTHTWYHMQIAVTGMKMINTCHAAWHITAIVPRICIIEKAHHPTRFAISKSNTLWSVEAWNWNFQYWVLIVITIINLNSIFIYIAYSVSYI